MRQLSFRHLKRSSKRLGARRHLALESLENRWAFAADFVDADFGNDGTVELHFDGDGMILQTESAIQPDQKILITHSRGAIASEIVRLLPDGSLDEAFGDGGRVHVDFSAYEDLIHGIALDGSNRILISGGTDWHEETSFVARYTSDGELDSTFGDQGIVTFKAGLFGIGHRLRILEDGNIIAAASSHENSLSPEMSGMLIKLDADGNWDTSFGDAGRVALPSTVAVSDLAIQPDGRIVLVGMDQEHRTTLIRYESDGTLDSSFGERGISTTRISTDEDHPTRVEIGPSGDIFVAGRFTWSGGIGSGAAVARFDSVGTLDESYGHGGLFHSPSQMYRGSPPHETDLIVTENGEVLFLGHVPDPPSQQNLGALVFRVSPDGKSFSSVELGSNLFGGSLAQQADGQLIVGGFDENWETNGDIFTFVTRLHVDGPMVELTDPIGETVGYDPVVLLPVVEQIPSDDDSTPATPDTPTDPPIVVRDDHFAVLPNSGETTIQVWLNDSFSYQLQETPKITAIDADSDDGEIRLDNSGWQIFYTPPRDFVGTKTFSYTVDDQYTANVSVEVTEKLVEFRLVPTDSEGHPIVSVVGGTHFYLDVYVTDLRPDATGVASAYFDTYLSDTLQPSPPELGPNFSAEDGILSIIRDNYAVTPHVFPGGIGLPSFAMVWNMTDVGGRSDSSGAGEQLLARILLTAELVQYDKRVELRTARVDYLRNSAITLNGRSEAVPSGAIRHDSVSLEIVTGWQNQELPGDVNRDEHFTAQDILVLINSINLHGSRNLLFELQSESDQNRITTSSSTTTERVRYMYDMNGDHFLSPTDVLMAINRLNAQSTAEGEMQSLFAPLVIDEDEFDSKVDRLFADPTAVDSLQEGRGGTYF